MPVAEPFPTDVAPVGHFVRMQSHVNPQRVGIFVPLVAQLAGQRVLRRVGVAQVARDGFPSFELLAAHLAGKLSFAAVNLSHVPGHVAGCGKVEPTLGTEMLARFGSAAVLVYALHCRGEEHLAAALPAGYRLGAEMFVHVALEQTFRLEVEPADGAAVGRLEGDGIFAASVRSIFGTAHVHAVTNFGVEPAATLGALEHREGSAGMEVQMVMLQNRLSFIRNTYRPVGSSFSDLATVIALETK